MTQQNVEIVRSMFEPFDGANVAAIDWGADAIRETVGRAYSPNVELRPLASGLGSGVGELYRGWDGLIRYLREWLEPFSEYHVDNLNYIEAGDCVLVPSRQWGIGGGSGARVELELTALYELRNGRIARVDQFDSLEEALAATGLSELSQQNVGFVAGIFDAAEGMDKQAMVAALPDLVPQLCDPEVEWIEDPQRADARVYRGHDGVIESWRQWLDGFGSYGFEVERIADCGGGDVFVAVREHGTGALSEAQVGATIYQVITVKDRKLRRYREFYDEAAALEAAGMSES